MSVVINIGCSVGSEEGSNVHQNKGDEDVFRGVRIPKSVGVVIDFSIIKPIFINRSKFLEVLKDQEAMLVIPYGTENGGKKVAYVVSAAEMEDHKYV